MTDDLKHRFEQLVADPPPPHGVPSEAVFSRVRSVRRRRTAGALTLAAAAVIAVAVAAGNLADIKSQPPVSHSPSAPPTSVIAPPTSTPTTTPSATTTSTQVSGAAHTPNNNTPPPSSSDTPAAPPLGVHVTLKPAVKGLTLTMNVTVSGTSLIPTAEGGKPLSTADNDFINLLGGTRYLFGDGGESGSDAGTVNCVSGTDPITRQQTYTPLDGSAAGVTSPSTHTYAKAGTYTFSYTVKYCGDNGWVPVTKTVKVTVK